MTGDGDRQAEIDAMWCESVDRVNARPTIGARCLEYLRREGRQLELKITPAAFDMRLSPLVSMAERRWSRVFEVEKGVAARKLLKALRAAREAGISGAQTRVDLNVMTDALSGAVRLADAEGKRKPNWSRFIARDVGEVYAWAFDRKPGVSRREKGRKLGGPFVNFAYFVISEAPDIERFRPNGEEYMGRKTLEKESIATYVSDEREAIDLVWRRHENSRWVAYGISP